MKIWFVDHYAQPPKYKAIIRQTLFARYLTNAGNNVRIFCASTVHNTSINLIWGKELFKEETIEGVLYTYVHCRSYTGNGLKRIRNMYEFAWRLPYVFEEVVRKEGEPDLIIACSMTLQACRAGIRLAKKHRIKVISQVTDLWPESIAVYNAIPRLALWPFYRLERWIYSNSDALVFSMEGAKDYLQEKKLDKENGGPLDLNIVHLINNGVDLKHFQNDRDFFQLEDADLDNPELFKVVYTGSIRKINNLSVILDAAQLIKNQQIKFLIWGAGEELPALRQRVEDEHIENVVFKGQVDKKYIPFITSSADVNLVHGRESSILQYGISANKLFDCLAAAKPILVTMNSKYNPVIDYGAGIQAREQTAVCIAEAINLMAESDENSRTSMCRAAAEAARNYDFPVLAERLNKIIQNVLSQSR